MATTDSIDNQHTDLADALVALPWDDFVELVSLDVKGRSPDGTSEALAATLPAVERWVEALNEIYRHIDSQLSHRKAERERVRDECRSMGPDGRDEWWEHERDYKTWKGGAVHFKRKVLDTQSEAKVLRADLRRQNNRVRNSSAYKALAHQVRVHRDGGGGPGADAALWAAHDQIRTDFLNDEGPGQ